MFSLNPKIERLDLKSSEIVTVVSSGNRPFVAVSGPAQEADAYIISAKEGAGRYVYICLHMVGEDRRLFFTSDECPTTESKVHEVETDAVGFVEDMGFMIVKKNMLDGHTGSSREGFIRKLVPFAEDLKEIRERGEKEKEEKKAKVVEVEAEEDEYEEVIEEVYEEVPVEEGDEPDETEPSRGAGGEEDQSYESLDDIMEDDSSDLKAGSSGKMDKTVVRAEPKEVKAETKIGAVSKEEPVVEVEAEISDTKTSEAKTSGVVESTGKEIPDASVSRVAPGDEKVIREGGAKRTGSEFFVDEGKRDLVKLLISL